MHSSVCLLSALLSFRRKINVIIVMMSLTVDINVMQRASVSSTG